MAEAADILQRQLDAAERKIKDLETDNQKQRDEIRDRTAERDVLQTQASDLGGKVPKDGQRVLSKAEADRYEAFMQVGGEGVKGDPEKLTGVLNQAARDRADLVTTRNRDALNTLGFKPSVLNWRQFDSVVIAATKDGDDVNATVKDGDTETPWEQWVKDKGLEGDLKDLGLTQTVTVVPALGQVGGGSPPNTDTWSQAANSRFGVTKKE